MIMHRLAFCVKVPPRGSKEFEKVVPWWLIVSGKINIVLTLSTAKRSALAMKEIGRTVLAGSSQAAEIDPCNLLLRSARRGTTSAHMASFMEGSIGKAVPWL